MIILETWTTPAWLQRNEALIPGQRWFHNKELCYQEHEEVKAQFIYMFCNLPLALNLIQFCDMIDHVSTLFSYIFTVCGLTVNIQSSQHLCKEIFTWGSFLESDYTEIPWWRSTMCQKVYYLYITTNRRSDTYFPVMEIYDSTEERELFEITSNVVIFKLEQIHSNL